MALTRKKQRTVATNVDVRVDERFESGIRLQAGPPSSRAPRSRGHEVQRRARRARVLVSVDIHLSSEAHFFCGLSGDVSEGGLFVSTYLPLPIGSSVELEFSLPGSEETLKARGRVRWMREHSLHEPRGFGIAFEGLEDAERERIHAFCSKRPALYYDDLG